MRGSRVIVWTRHVGLDPAGGRLALGYGQAANGDEVVFERPIELMADIALDILDRRRPVGVSVESWEVRSTTPAEAP